MLENNSGWLHETNDTVQKYVLQTRWYQENKGICTNVT